MARIRTIKPEFWTDDLLGSVSREARLLFIATWNLADDEGLLRWTAPFLKGAVFPFDDDLSVSHVQKFMDEICAAGIIFNYVGGRSQQALGYIVNFLKHQKINRPGPSRLPPPPLADPKVKAMYSSRDGGVCHLCCLPVDTAWSEKYQSDFMVSPDHLTPQAAGGSDFPSNIKTAHLTCNKGKRDRTTEQYIELLRAGETVAQKRYPERFSNYSVNSSVTELGTGKGSREIDLVPTASRFDDFWGFFPRKVSKEKAEVSYLKALKLVSNETLLDGASAYAAQIRRNGTEERFILSPVSWLEAKRWTDHQNGHSKKSAFNSPEELAAQAALKEKFNGKIA